MPELPEVETVKNILKKQVVNKKILSVVVNYPNIIANKSKEEFISKLKNQVILDVKRRGKWLMFELNDYYLLSHLRMEGKYYLKKNTDEVTPHQHIIFIFSDCELRYNDTRKFGRMYLLDKDNVYNEKPLSELGLEPFSVSVEYLKEKYQKINKPIKTVLLDQKIVVGIGNIYADEILFLSKINPYKSSNSLNYSELEKIINNTCLVLSKAIKLGGTTIRSYTSSENVRGNFQDELLVHTKSICPVCQSKIKKVKIGGRGTYYCEKCQKS